MSKTDNFQIWAKKFVAINDFHIKKFINSISNNLDLHEMKRCFSDQYQDKITFSYVFCMDYKKFRTTIHMSIEGRDALGYNSDYGYSSGAGLGFGYGTTYGSGVGTGSGDGGEGHYYDSDERERISFNFFETDFVGRICCEGSNCGHIEGGGCSYGTLDRIWLDYLFSPR